MNNCNRIVLAFTVSFYYLPNRAAIRRNHFFGSSTFKIARKFWTIHNDAVYTKLSLVICYCCCCCQWFRQGPELFSTTHLFDLASRVMLTSSSPFVFCPTIPVVPEKPSIVSVPKGTNQKLDLAPLT